MILENITILHNKLDLEKLDTASVQHYQIYDLVAFTLAGYAPVVTILYILNYTVDVVREYLVHCILTTLQGFNLIPCLVVIQLFGVNNPSQYMLELQVDVVGGFILHGVLRVGDDIKVHQGIFTRTKRVNVEEAMFSRYFDKDSFMLICEMT